MAYAGGMTALAAYPAAAGLRARLPAPADKSISQRALILATLALGESRIANLLPSADVHATAQALRQLGIVIRPDATTPTAAARDWRVQGVGIGGLRPPTGVLDFANSGTGARLMLGVLATHPFTATFTGDASLVRRPMKRVLQPLAEFGATYLARGGGFLPLTLAGAVEPLPIRQQLQIPSAQVKSALLLAALNAPGESILLELTPTRDHTERMLPCFGGTIRVLPHEGGGQSIHLLGEQELRATEMEIPGDPSSAAFLAAAALIVPGSEVIVERVGINPRRTGIFTALREMGADISFANEVTRHGEPIADIRARCAGEVALRGVHIAAERAASMIDEYPILAVVAAFADGETRMDGLGELRVKESDRLAAITRLLRVNGVELESDADSLRICGGSRPPGGGCVRCEGDHRIAMASLILGLGAGKAVSIDDDAMIATSFPGFAETIASLGGDIRPL